MEWSDETTQILKEGLELQMSGDLENALKKYQSASELANEDVRPSVSALFLQEGKKLEDSGNFEGAYVRYKYAADLENSYAMMAIVGLYLNPEKPFRGLKRTSEEITAIIISGRKMPPLKPDVQTVLKWLHKAVNLKNGDAAGMLGAMLYEGEGIPQDKSEGLKYLRLGVQYGSQKASQLLNAYQVSEKRMSDAEYWDCLENFKKTADNGNSSCMRLYPVLKNGTRKQMLRFSYVLLAGKSTGNPYYKACDVPATREGIPLMPVVPRPGGGGRWIRVNWDAFPTDKPLLALSANPMYLYRFQKMNQKGNLQLMHHMKIAGTACYRSPAFGEFEEEKKALLLCPDLSAELDMKFYSQIVSKFSLHPIEYNDDPTFFVDSAEGLPMGYSIELASILDNHVDILFRYHVENAMFCNTINGSDIRKQFKPELISLTLD